MFAKTDLSKETKRYCKKRYSTNILLKHNDAKKQRYNYKIIMKVLFDYEILSF